MQLFEADFNPMPNQIHVRTRQPSNLIIDTNIASLAAAANDSGIISGLSARSNLSSSSSNSSSNNDNVSCDGSDLLQTIKLDEEELEHLHATRANFQTSVCKMLGISLEINSKPLLCGKKLMDEHYEYMIEIRLGDRDDDHWFIFRRYSRIRQLHEQMSKLYPLIEQFFCINFKSRE